MRILVLMSLLLPLLVGVAGQAQTNTAKGPLVVFVEESSLQMASVTDSGPDGLTRLAEVFTRLGARTTWQRLRAPLPADTAVVVLVRPRRPLPVDYLARLWEIVGSGKNLLLAVEPQGLLGASTEAASRGLGRLINLDEGLSIDSGILIEPWFTNKSFSELFGVFSYGYADAGTSAITEPLRHYQLPVALWGARPLTVDALGAESQAWSLVSALPQYVETATNIFPRSSDPGQPYQLDLDQDRQGWVSVVGIGENRVVGSRVALLGDGEIVQNGYGLAVSSENVPLFAADYILTERLAAWLLGLPEDQYPALPGGLTWIALDGDASDWPDGIPITSDDPTDVSILSLNIQQARAIRNNNYLYIDIDTVAPANPDAQIDIELDTLGAGRADTVVSIQPGQALAQRGTAAAEPVADASIGIGTGIELRLPLRVAGIAPHIVSLCLSSARALAFPQAPDCVANVEIAGINQLDPAPLPASGAPLLAIKGDGRNRINLRSAPDDKADVITTVPSGSVFTAVGVSANGEWVKLENTVYSGWVARSVLFAPANLDGLPILP